MERFGFVVVGAAIGVLAAVFIVTFGERLGRRIARQSTGTVAYHRKPATVIGGLIVFLALVGALSGALVPLPG